VGLNWGSPIIDNPKLNSIPDINEIVNKESIATLISIVASILFYESFFERFYLRFLPNNS
jgi:hypothetical protein